MSVVRARSLEAWLKGLVVAYQAPTFHRYAERFSNLTQLSTPSQVSAMSMKHGAGYVAAIILTHDSAHENASVKAVRISDLQELAEFSELADEFFETATLQTRLQKMAPSIDIYVGDTGVAQVAAMLLAEAFRKEPVGLSPGTFLAGMKQAFQVEPEPAALWLVRYRSPFPEHRPTLLALEPRRLRQSKIRKKSAQPTKRAVPAPTERAPSAFAAYTEPSLWFGPPSLPSVPDRILKRPWSPARDERLVYHAKVGDTETFVYNTGLVLAATADRSAALSTVNQVFAALSRSGVLSFVAPDYDLIEIAALDMDTGQIQGSHAALTQRNRLLGPPQTDHPTSFSRYLPEEVASKIFGPADSCALDQRLAIQSLRLNSAVTLLANGVHTEAFVTAWTLAETALQFEFVTFWISEGRSKRAIKDMDWTVSQQTDLLMAVGRIDSKLGARIHRLRKKRNDIVHDLLEATSQETSECIELAAELKPLPRVKESLRPLQVLA